MKYRWALLVTILAVFFVCTGGSQPGSQPPPQRFRLYVSIFSFIPDAAGDQFRLLRLRIKKEFEAKNPTVELWLKELDPAD